MISRPYKKYLIDFIKLYSIPIGLTLLFFFLWFPHVFIVNESLNLATAYEVDPGYMLDSVINILATYNQSKSFTSATYGWTYFFLAFIILKPITLLLTFFYPPSISVQTTLLLVRLFHFTLCLASMIALYILLRKLFNNIIYAAIGCLFYIIPMYWGMNIFYFLHPEPAGLLFIILSLIILEKYRSFKSIKESDKYFYFGFSMIVLSALSKQQFFFTAIPVIIIYLYYYFTLRKIEFNTFFFMKSFLWLFFSMLFISLAILAIIHPFAFVNITDTLNYQIVKFQGHLNTNLTLTALNAYKNYLYSIISNPFLAISLMFCFYVIIDSSRKAKRNIYKLIICSSIPLIIFIFISNERLFCTLFYFIPICIYLIISDLYFIEIISSIHSLKIKRFLLIIISVVFVIIFFSRFNIEYNKSQNRLNYIQSDTYLIYNFINNHVDNGSKLAISHAVPIPENKNLIYFHWWQNDLSKLGEFNPDYFIYITDFRVNGMLADYTKIFNAYVIKNNYIEVKKIGTITIYKK